MFEQDAVELTHLAIAMGLGLLVGLERERSGKAAGMRTFSMAALVGFVSWKMGLTFALASLVFVSVLIVTFNVWAIRRSLVAETTTSVALFLITLVGMMTAAGHLLISVAVVIFVMLLLSWKEEMVLFSQHLKRSELHAAITLGLLTFVILPVLPRGTIDPWGLFDPYSIWLTVVLISAIGFINYILLRRYGGKGILYTGFLGGLVNSTATSVELSQKARAGDEGTEELVFRGILWAKVASFLRNVLVLAIFAPQALPASLVPISLMLLVVLLLALRKAKAVLQSDTPLVSLESPFSLRSALQFGAMLAAITVLATIAQQLLGDVGFYIVAFLGGIVSSASTAATAATMFDSGQITGAMAGTAVVIASVASSIVILPVAWRGSGSQSLTRRLAIAIGLVMIAITIGIVFNSYFFEKFAATQAWFGVNVPD